MESSQLEKDFIPVTENDLDVISHFLSVAGYEESNHNLVNMILWSENYPLFQCRHEHWLLLLGIHEGKLFIYMPLCEPQYFNEAIMEAKKIFDHYHTPFILSCFVKEQVEWFRQLFPCACVESYRDSADYVYSAEKLRTFSGKKLQKKRNHLNAFYKEYEGRWSYESLDENNVDECRQFLKQWKPDTEDEYLRVEIRGIFRILDLLGRIPYKGGCIRIDGQVRAFAIGSRLTDRMCQENIEKADDQIRGLYQAILKEWLNHEFSDVEYVNREDDMGHEALRHAKMAYYPEFMIEKYQLCGKENQI